MPSYKNYSKDRNTLENFNPDDKYSSTGESEFSRDTTIPFDQNEVLSERHYSIEGMEQHGRKYVHVKEPDSQHPVDMSGKGPKGYRRSDEKIKEDVCETLYRDTEVDASQIEVFVNHGTVTLKGSVESRDQKKSAEYIIENLAGVRDVFNELRVRRDDPKKGPSPYGLMDNITGLN